MPRRPWLGEDSTPVILLIDTPGGRNETLGKRGGSGALGTQVELYHRFHVPGLREQVEELNALDRVHLGQYPQIARQCRRVTGHVGESRSASLHESRPQTRAQTTARRIDQYAIRPARQVRDPALDRLRDQLRMQHSVVARVHPSVARGVKIRLDADHLPVVPSKRQGEQTDAGEKVE